MLPRNLLKVTLFSFSCGPHALPYNTPTPFPHYPPFSHPSQEGHQRSHVQKKLACVTIDNKRLKHAAWSVCQITSTCYDMQYIVGPGDHRHETHKSVMLVLINGPASWYFTVLPPWFTAQYQTGKYSILHRNGRVKRLRVIAKGSIQSQNRSRR